MQKKLILISGIIIALIIVVLVTSQKSKTNNTEIVDETSSSATENGFDVSTHDGTYDIDTTTSTIAWEGRGIGKKHTGTLPVSGSLSFADDTMSGTFSLDLKNIISTDANGGNDKLIQHLQSADFFDVTKYPTATLSLNTLSPKSPEGGDATNATVEALLKVKDIEAPITFPVVITDVDDAQMHIQGSVTIDRTVWGITFNSSSFVKDLGDAAIADEVLITFDLTAKK